MKKSLARGLCFDVDGKFNKLSVRVAVSTSLNLAFDANVGVATFLGVIGFNRTDDEIEDRTDDFGVLIGDGV